MSQKPYPLNMTPVGLAYFTGWANLGSGFLVGRYYIDASRTVHVEGSCTRTSGVLATIATLPEGFRPAGTMRYLTAAYDGAVSGFALIDVDTLGVITLQLGGPNSTHLNGIVFRVAE